MPSLHPTEFTPEQFASMLARLRTRPGAPAVAAYAAGDEAFELFLLLANIPIRRELGLSLTDLADQPWRDWFDDERDPIECANELLRDPLELM